MILDFTVLPCISFLSIRWSPCQDFTLTILRKFLSTSFCGFTLRYSGWVFCVYAHNLWGHFGRGFVSLLLHSIEYTFPMSLHPLAFMFHQCILAQLMQEILSYDSDMGQYLNFFSPYGDLQNLVTILHLPHLLLHSLCFAHINKPSGNHYLLLFASLHLH